jgi:homoserine kinase
VGGAGRPQLPEILITLRPASVRVPASTSNLGAGFDALGMAVRKYVSARFEPGGDRLTLRREGTLAEIDGPDEDDLLRRAFLAELEERGVRSVAGTLLVTSEVPIGRGLGTSAAATVGGLLLAREVLRVASASWPEGAREDAPSAGDAGAGTLDGAWAARSRVLDRAAALEGHPDNAAPALFGGLVGMSPKPSGGFRVYRLTLSPRVAFTYAAPETRVSTSEARRVMPAEYPRATAIAALGRLVSLLQGLEHGDADALALGLADDIHVPYRLPLIPGGADVLGAAVEAGAWGATISGSGSGIIALSPHERRTEVEMAMRDAFTRAGNRNVVAFALEPELEGARVTRP